VAEVRLVRLSPEHEPLLKTFVCTPSVSAEPVVAYLQNRALQDQADNMSATFIYVAEAEKRVDAYVTMSVAAWEFPSNFRERRKIGRREVPSLHIGYIGVSDIARAQHKDPGLGRQIFDRVKFEAFQMNAYAGVRFVTLDVEASNWRAYQIYRTSWDMHALTLKIDNNPVPPPDPKLAKLPSHIPPEYKIKMCFDLAYYGSFWPRPNGWSPARPFE
jgi:ribosomal protein S18 acetylase RimI-like enzyme